MVCEEAKGCRVNAAFSRVIFVEYVRENSGEQQKPETCLRFLS